MSKSVTFIVETMLDRDRSTRIVPRWWAEARIKLYHEFTLKSVLNQSFQDFRIFILCGSHHKDLTQNAKWHERCEICYDDGQSKLADINTDYISISRIDSDDLFHRNAMADVRDNLLLTDRRECLIVQKCRKWDRVNRLLGIHERSSPPTITHIFPKSIYKDWNLFYSQHLLSHGRAGGKLPGTIKLPPFNYCIVGHWIGNNRIRHGNPLRVMTEEERQKMIADHPWVILEKEKIKEILKDFAVEEKWIK